MNGLNRVGASTCLLLLVAVAVSSATGQVEEDAYEDGVRHLQEGAFQEAGGCFDDAVRDDPKNGKAHRLRAFARLLGGDPDAAIAAFTEATGIEPPDPALFYGRGLAYALLRKHKEAARDFTEAVRLDAKYAAAYFERANVRAHHNPFGAFVDVTRAARYGYLESGFEGAARRRARGIASAGSYAELGVAPRVDLGGSLIYSCWRFIYEQYPDSVGGPADQAADTPCDAEAYRKSALRYARKRELDKCIEALDQALRVDPKDWSALKLRGAVNIIKREWNAAVADFTRAIDLNPVDTDCHAYRASAYGELGDIESSARDWDEVARLMEREIEQDARELDRSRP